MASSSTSIELPSLQRLQSDEQNELLDVIDSMRSQGMGDLISLPQLIVCGDQSSGKSSVLEAISGIPFPRQETLCTRFATEVILRKTSNEKITASIVPEKDRSEADIALLKDFQHELKTHDEFTTLFENAAEAMGRSCTTSGTSFFKDILRIEICGPSKPQLTLVDLPGLIHTATKTQTKDDVELVHALVDQYLISPRSIILAVISAKNDIGNQIILQRARIHDKYGRRTLGIITKPDLLIRGSKNEEAFISLARNEDVNFDLGWHVVKNIDLADPETRDGSRDEQETQYFEKSNFSRLTSHTVGVGSLRTRLGRVLFNQIRTELPKLVEEIESKLSSTKAVSDKLGPSRAKVHEQQAFLVSLSQEFSTICRDAVKGNYEHEFFQGAEPERRLCAKIMNKHLEFARTIRKNGATWNIIETLSDQIDESDKTRNEAIKDACELLKRSRGRELPGLPNTALVGELFKQYKKPWQELAQKHISDIWETTVRFLEVLLSYLTDGESCEKVQRHWLLPKMDDRLSFANEKLSELLLVHEDQPMTTDARFITGKMNRRQTKIKNEVLKRLGDEGNLEAYDVEEISKFVCSLDQNEEKDIDMLAAEEALDNMNAFYEVAVALFSDNVPTLAIQLPLVRGLPDIFCPKSVMDMDSATIQRIAGESEGKALERKAIERKMELLQNGRRTCKQYARRTQPFISPAKVHNSSSDQQISDSSNTSRPKPTSPIRSANKPLTTPESGSQKAPSTPHSANGVAGVGTNLFPPGAKFHPMSRSPVRSAKTPSPNPGSRSLKAPTMPHYTAGAPVVGANLLPPSSSTSRSNSSSSALDSNNLTPDHLATTTRGLFMTDERGESSSKTASPFGRSSMSVSGTSPTPFSGPLSVSGTTKPTFDWPKSAFDPTRFFGDFGGSSPAISTPKPTFGSSTSAIDPSTRPFGGSSTPASSTLTSTFAIPTQPAFGSIPLPTQGTSAPGLFSK